MRLRATLLAALALCLAPASAGASVPALRGAAAHPLSESQADFDHELDMLQATGANEVRIDMGWATLEFSGKGQYDTAYLNKAKQFVSDAQDRGIKVVLTFWQTPCWASSAPDSVKQGCAGAWYDPPRNVQLYPPTDPQDFADAAAYVAGQLGSDLAAIEVWNEPNYIPYFFNVPGATQADQRHNAETAYAAMLNATYQAVKAAAPSVAVIGPAMLDSDADFLTGLYDRGIKQPHGRRSRCGRSTAAATRAARRCHAEESGGVAASYLLGVPDRARRDGPLRRQRKEAVVHRARLVELCESTPAAGPDIDVVRRARRTRRSTSPMPIGSCVTAGTMSSSSTCTRCGIRAATRAVRARWA